MSLGWYVESGGKVEGPVSSGELHARAAAGRLLPTDGVSRDGKAWVPASEVEELAFADAVASPTLTDPLPPAADGSHAETVAVRPEPLPGYEIIDVLGRGACGVVFRSRQTKLDRVVALKMVLSDRPVTPAMQVRFRKEAVALARLNHPNVVGVYDCGHHAGRAFFAMELLEGEDLARRVERGGPLDEATAWHVARQTAAALAHAAGLGIFHRDVKPSNLFLCPPPTGFPLPPGVPLVKVTDFGIALTRDAGEGDARLTAAGVILGTPAYMPPEQFVGSDVDHRADIYALGATVYHALAGAAPYSGTNIWEVMLKKTAPPPPLGPGVSRESVELVSAMMARQAGDRIDSYPELIARIDALPFTANTAGTPTPAPTVAPPTPRRRVKPFLLAALGVLALIGAGVLGVRLFVAKPQEFVAAGREELFDGASLIGWAPVGGPAWTVEKDEEKTPVVTGEGGMRRPFRARRDFRVILGLDLYKASAAEVVVAVADGPAATARRWSVRVAREGGATFGVRDGERGEFRPLGPAAAVPTPKQLEAEERRPYVEVRYERAGGKVRACYRNEPLGEADANGELKPGEVLVFAEGGPVRIDTAAVEELVEKPPR